MTPHQLSRLEERGDRTHRDRRGVTHEIFTPLGQKERGRWGKDMNRCSLSVEYFTF